MPTATRAATGVPPLGARRSASPTRSGVPRAAEPRKALAHYGAPALFLLAVTVAVLLIRAGLESGSSGQPTTTATPATTRAASHRTKPHRKHVAPAAQYYTVQSGDTFGSISAKT